MQVFKVFMKITRKQLKSLIIYLVIFISIGFLMSRNSSESNEFQETKLKISISDMDNSEASKSFCKYIAKTNKIVNVGEKKNERLDSLYYLKVDAIIIINNGYGNKISSGSTENLFKVYKVPGSYSSELFDNQVNRYVSIVSAYVSGGMSINEACTKVSEIPENNADVNRLNFSKKSSVEFGTHIAYYYQYLAYILTAVLITTLCPTLLVLMEKGIKNRTNCSSLSVSRQIWQITAATVVFSLAVYLILTVIALILYGSEVYNEKGVLAWINGLVFLIFAMMLTVFISVLAPSRKAVDMIANTFSLGMCFLCGVFVPQSYLSNTVLNIGKLLPAYWYVKANNMLALSDGEIFGFGKYLTYIGIEFAFSVTLFCLILLVLKTKRSSDSV